ncbi:MAG: sodium-dependent transporter [Salinivirgaceae bacterium]|nr:sodium-dependent transporter [Salinivirgaceae bacterium]
MKNLSNTEKRGSFGSKFGVIAAAAGSAVGLGNIWKFPYIAGQNGGGAFLLVYLVLLIAIGAPIMISEFMIGRETRKNPVGAFKILAPTSSWKWVGIMGVIASVFILAFYSTVAGWTLEYIRLAVTNQFLNLDSESLRLLFQNFTASPTLPIFWQILFLFLTCIIVMAGIEKGIERYAKYLMPILFILIIMLCIRSLTLPNAAKGLSFLFNPDFSKIDSNVILRALGQVFFSLSLGMGTLITYGSYIQNKVKLPEIAIKVSLTDSLVAILAGMAIFPAVFAFGFAPTEGTGLVFVVLPQVFNSMPMGQIFAIFFFLLLAVAAITSSISLLEVIVAYLIEEYNLKRKLATIISISISLFLGLICTMSFAPNSVFMIGGVNFFDVLDYLTSNIMLPLGGLCIVVFVGWRLNKSVILRQLEVNPDKSIPVWVKGLLFIIRYIAPLAILSVFLNSLGVF